MSRPISAITAAAKGSSSPLRTPAEPTYTPRPKICPNKAAAIGERTELSPQANSTASGGRDCGGIASSALPVQDRDQSEKAARGAEIDVDLALEPLHHQVRAFVVQTAPRHIEGLDAVGRRRADCGVVAVADYEIILHHAAERRQREHMRDHWRVVGEANVENEPVTGNAQLQRVGTAVVSDRPEIVILKE